jgi:hypothetical protein
MNNTPTTYDEWTIACVIQAVRRLARRTGTPNVDAVRTACRLAVRIGATDLAVQLIADGTPWTTAVHLAALVDCPSPLAGDVSAPSPAASTVTP